MKTSLSFSFPITNEDSNSTYYIRWFKKKDSEYKGFGVVAHIHK